MFVCLNGKIIDQKKAMISVCDHGFLYGDGIYETMRTFHGEVWLLKEHLKRLRKSAKAVGINVPWSDGQLNKWISQVLKKNKYKDYRIRITISRGCNNFDFQSTQKPTLVIEAKKLKKLPKKMYEDGVSAITFEVERAFPLIKSVSMLPSILARQEAKKKGAYEAFLVNQKGEITEGSLSNVFVVSNRTLITPREGMLEGTVRNYLMKILKNKFKIEQRPVQLKKLYDYDEIFITSSIKGVLPVVKIDGEKIGKEVGPVSKEIMVLFEKSIQ